MDDMSRIEEALQNKVEVQLEYEETSIVGLLLEVTNDDEMIVLANSGNFDAMIQNYQQGQKWSEIKELLKQKKWEKMYDESRREELANVLNPG